MFLGDASMAMSGYRQRLRSVSNSSRLPRPASIWWNSR